MLAVFVWNLFFLNQWPLIERNGQKQEERGVWGLLRVDHLCPWLEMAKNRYGCRWPLEVASPPLVTLVPWTTKPKPKTQWRRLNDSSTSGFFHMECCLLSVSIYRSLFRISYLTMITGSPLLMLWLRQELVGICTPEIAHSRDNQHFPFWCDSIQRQ